MIREEYIHSDSSSEILNVAFEVHKIIGPGFVQTLAVPKSYSSKTISSE